MGLLGNKDRRVLKVRLVILDLLATQDLLGHKVTRDQLVLLDQLDPQVILGQPAQPDQKD